MSDLREALWRMVDMADGTWSAIPGCLFCDDAGCTKACARSRLLYAKNILRDNGSRPEGENPERSGGVEGEARQSGDAKRQSPKPHTVLSGRGET